MPTSSTQETPNTDINAITQQVEQWLNDVVIGLNLCPFAAKPQRNKQIKIFVSEATQEEALLEDILLQLIELSTTEPEKLETTLVVVPNMLQDFWDYNFCIDWVEGLIKQQDWEGIFQVATFHPDYCFGGAAPEDDENLTNRSPYPIFHLIREREYGKRCWSTTLTLNLFPTQTSREFLLFQKKNVKSSSLIYFVKPQFRTSRDDF